MNAEMYSEHFGLEQLPFRITPDTRLFYTGGRRGDVLEALVYAVTSGEGIVKVVGEVGTGKTMLCRMLEERVPENVRIAYLANPSLTPDDILQAIALELGLEVARGSSRLQVMHRLHEDLLRRHAANQRVVALVEEAQSMPLDTLEEIRLLSNLETKNEKLLQIVLFGQPELDATLTRAEIRQLRDRVTHGFRLTPLSRDEVRAYLNFRLRASGYRGRDVFTDAAFRLIARASEGLTRRVNVLADKAMLAAFADGAHEVTARHVKVAVRDSGLGSESQRARGWPPLAEAVCAVGLALLAAAVGWYLGHGAAAPVATMPVPAETAAATPELGAGVSLDARAEPAPAPAPVAVDAAAATTATAAPGEGATGRRPEAASTPSPRANAPARGEPHAGTDAAPPVVEAPSAAPAEGAVAPPAPPPPAQASTAASPALTAPPQSPPVPERPAAAALEPRAPGQAESATGPGAEVLAGAGEPGGDAESGPAVERPVVAPVPANASSVPPSPVNGPGAEVLAGAGEPGGDVGSVPALERAVVAPAPADTASAPPPQASATAEAQSGDGLGAPATDGAVASVSPGERRGVSAAPVEVQASLSAGPAPEPKPRLALTGAEVLARRLVVTRAWLKEVDDNHYSIQLLATEAGQRRNLEAFLRERHRAGDIDEVYVYETVIRGRPWFGVLYGYFSSLSAARRALRELSEDLLRHQPFIRNISDVDAVG
jgi:type II secretory pathway predicted ATPase ExeA